MGPPSVLLCTDAFCPAEGAVSQRPSLLLQILTVQLLLPSLSVIPPDDFISCPQTEAFVPLLVQLQLIVTPISVFLHQAKFISSLFPFTSSRLPVSHVFPAIVQPSERCSLEHNIHAWCIRHAPLSPDLLLLQVLFAHMVSCLRIASGSVILLKPGLGCKAPSFLLGPPS